MKRFLAVMAVLLLALSITAACAQEGSDDDVDVEITDIRFSSDWKNMIIFTDFINGTDSDITVIELAFPSLSIRDKSGSAGETKNIIIRGLNIYVEANHYVSRQFTIKAPAGIVKREFDDDVQWTYDFDLSYEVGDEEDEEDNYQV